MKNKYELLDDVNSLFQDIDLSQTLLISCQHLLGTQYAMFQRIIKEGLSPAHCFIIGKNYSTNRTVYQKLKRLGCYVDEASIEYSPTECFDEWFSFRLKVFIEKIMLMVDLTEFRKIVILDDGGLLIHEVSQSQLPLEIVKAVEQTSSGWHRLQAQKIPFDVFYVARTRAKLKHETPLITKLCFDRIVAHAAEQDLENPKILIIGSKGYIGSSLLGRFKEANYSVEGCDIKHGHMSEQLSCPLDSFDIIVGTTGSQSVSEDDLSRMKHNVSLISVSSSDREFPALLFRQGKTVLHQDHYLNGKCLVNSGFPITFQGNYHELSPNQIEITCSLLLFGVYMASIDDDDWRNEGQFTALIVSRLTRMHFQQV